MIELIAGLLAAGHAYQTPAGSVYFDVRSFPSYGELSGNRLDDLRPGHGAGRQSADPGKHFHADWALWKSAPAGRELTWGAPWGTGFPGWHTECSAMSLHYLGDTIDVHTGGIDLRFPHHEDERAQSNSVTGHEVVRHWVHGEHLLFEGRKMAKSTRNVVLLGDLAGRGLDPLALRLAFLEHRYRQQMNLTWGTLAAADAVLHRWRQRVAEWANSPSKPMCAQYVADFAAAFDADLDTPAALRVLRALERDTEIPPGAEVRDVRLRRPAARPGSGAWLGQRAGAPPLPPGAAELLAGPGRRPGGSRLAGPDRLRADLAALGVTVPTPRRARTWATPPPADHATDSTGPCQNIRNK